MDVIDISSTESEDDDEWDDEEDVEEEINRCSSNNQRMENLDGGFNLDILDTGDFALVDDVSPLEDANESLSLKRHASSLTVLSSMDEKNNGHALMQATKLSSNPGQIFYNTTRNVENDDTYQASLPPIEQTVRLENDSQQKASDGGGQMLNGYLESSKKSVKRALPPSILSRAHPKGHEAKSSMDNKQKRVLPSSLQSTLSKSLGKVRGENTVDVQIIDSLGNLGSTGGLKFNQSIDLKFGSKDIIGGRNDHIQVHKNAGDRRQLPLWMSEGSASSKFPVSSTITPSSMYSDTVMDPSGIREKPTEEDERLIFQAALQDISQPTDETDVPAGSLTVPLLRHQRIALAWMQRKETSLHCSGGILADDQGLGKTISVIALIQKERPQQENFSSSVSSCAQANAFNLDEVDNIFPEHETTGHSTESLGTKPQKCTLPSNHLNHTVTDPLHLVEIDDEHNPFDAHFGDDAETMPVKSEMSDLSKPKLKPPKMKNMATSLESNTSKKAQTENSVKTATYKGRPAGGTLVVCPASILWQWARELEEKIPFSTKLSVLIYHGSGRSKDPNFLAKYDVVLTTYSIVSNEVPKQPLNIDDDGERRNMDNGSLLPEFSFHNERKKTSDAHKKGKKRKKRAYDCNFDYDCGPLARVRWFRVVLDEAQTIKNCRTQVSRACCGLRAKRRWCLSGTPLQNSLDDLYSYFRFLKYDPYSAYSSFCSSIKSPIFRNAIIGYKKLQAVLKTVMLRRTKGTLIDGEPIIRLPPKEVYLKKIYFSMEERVFYSNLEADSRQKFKAFAAAGTVNENYANILALLLRLRQACDHPLLVKGYHSSPVTKASVKIAQKLPRDTLVHLFNQLDASWAICAICSDQPEDAVVTTCGHVFCYQCISGYLTGDDNICPASSCQSYINADSYFSEETLRSCFSAEQVNNLSEDVEQNEPSFHSSKIAAAMNILKSVCKRPHPEANIVRCDERQPAEEKFNLSLSKVQMESDVNNTEDKPYNALVELPVKAIVFSQWTSMLDLVEISLNHSLLQYRRLDGSMSLASRDRAIKDFNSDPEVIVMLMSLKAGNLGLNMIAACHVILLDPWWNPTMEDQAIDRAHRIGQVRTVTVSRLTVSNTVEDRILALQEKKREMVSAAFGEDQTSGRAMRLTVEDLRYLFNV